MTQAAATTRQPGSLFSPARPAAASPAARVKPAAWVSFHSITEEAAAAALARAGFSVTPIVDKFDVKRWQFVDAHGHAWMLSREKFLKTGWLYS